MTYIYMLSTQEQPESTIHFHAPSIASTSSTCDDATEVLEACVIETTESMLRLASSLARDVAALRSRCFGSHDTCSISCPHPSQQVEEQTRCDIPDIQPSIEELVEQHSFLPSPRSYDYGILALKYMEFWNGATLSTSLDKMHVYKLQLVVTLLLNKGNIVRDKIMEVCQL
ncbi:hypothetical protein CK203_087359 [Vitis vinifera]|uniref:Uncharacterized protein n=1 Tax=Vitis vinifera TaxID=29760 RepID=A0A438BMH0_VITVI|nr:hypothetical protein CK203_087359 [Vitis vinifera]